MKNIQVEEVLEALRKCREAVNNTELPPNERFRLVRDISTPLIECDRRQQNEPEAKAPFGLLVTEALQMAGIPATYEYPGYIDIIEESGRRWAFGTANPLWGGHQMTPCGESVEGTYVEFADFPSEVEDKVEGIASAIAKAIEASPYRKCPKCRRVLSEHKSDYVGCPNCGHKEPYNP